MRKLKFLALVLLSMHISCEVAQRENPFEVDPGDNQGATLTGFAAIHDLILEPKCANPACHDGTFEPDFRTVEGSYNTLVYHPVIKNDEDLTYEYRVVPGDLQASWLYNRITTTNDTLGQMPLYAEPLSNMEIQSIMNWIEEGALSTTGQAPVAPNEVPEFNWYVAFSGEVNWNNWDQNRIDETRTEWAAPFRADANDTIRLLLHMEDDHLPPYELQQVQLLLASSAEYSGAVAYDASFFVGNYWTVSFPPNSFTAGDTNYFFLSYSDGQSLVQSPELEAPWWYKNHCSFYLN